MKVYIIPYNRVNNNFLNIVSSIELFETYYKTEKGPLGFNEDEKGRTLFRAIVEGAIRYSANNGEISVMDASYLSENPMWSFEGVFIVPTEFIITEIAKEKELRLTITKNQPLRKYGKPIKPEISTLFTDLYSRTVRKYAEYKIETLLERGIDMAVGNSDSLGSHFIMKQDSVFMQRLISSCNELGIVIKHVVSYRDIPAW